MHGLVVELAADQSLDVEDGVLRVDGGLVFGGVADQTLSVRGVPCNVRRPAGIVGEYTSTKNAGSGISPLSLLLLRVRNRGCRFRGERSTAKLDARNPHTCGTAVKVVAVFLLFQTPHELFVIGKMCYSRDSVALIVCDDVHATVLGDSHAGVGCAKVNADNRCVGRRLLGCVGVGRRACCRLGRRDEQGHAGKGQQHSDENRPPLPLHAR